MEISKEQKKYIVKALEQTGFVEVGSMGIYRMGEKAKQVVVDMSAGMSIYFNINGNKIDEDDEAGTLARIGVIIAEAMDGQLPTKKDSDEVIGDVPPVEEPVELPPEPEVQAPTPAMATSPNEHGLLDLIARYVGNDVLQVFGETGSGKSKFGLEAAREAIAAGKKVYYLDTERNLTVDDINSLKGCEYKYTPVLDEIDKIVQNLPAVDVVILDSIGFPVLTTYARLSVKQKGDALLKLIAIFGDLKIWAYKHNGIAIVTNQPESEFNKPTGHVFRPFGDKSAYVAKEIWKTKIEVRNQTQTKISIKAFRSRSVGSGTPIANMTITNDGIRIEVV